MREKLARSRWESSVPPDADKEENETSPPHFFSFEPERGDSSVLLKRRRFSLRSHLSLLRLLLSLLLPLSQKDTGFRQRHSAFRETEVEKGETAQRGKAFLLSSV